MPRSTAWKAPIAITSVVKSGLSSGDPPRERERISTPSEIASSNAARMLAPEHPPEHTL
ncbi:hypothetical protein A2U01_0111985 [Trifolium medium]|uniref:Uncharacterized protein n=1 Tax=Trifolium medium TaxID=97028 RepID=A0A392VUP8_9FABA|nr:hypothetical protein [Trifolium medium]